MTIDFRVRKDGLRPHIVLRPENEAERNLLQFIEDGWWRVATSKIHFCNGTDFRVESLVIDFGSKENTG